MAEEGSQAWEKWIPVIERLLWQCFYRILSFISYHAPIDESYQAAQSLSGTKGGEVYWVIPDRVFRWDNVEFSPGLKISVWFFGSALRRKNTVMVRRGWWTFYLLDVYVKRMARALALEKKG